MAIQVEIWQKAIKEELFANNEFLNHVTNRDENVIGGKVVHIPQSGGPADVERNRTVTPATARKRTDTDIVYVLQEFTTDPTHIPHADTVELSYDKTRSVIREDSGKMMQDVGDYMLYQFAENAAAGNLIPTTGAAAAASAPGATGTRKILTIDDLRAAKTYLNKQNVPRNERYIVLPSDMMDHLAADSDLRYAFQGVYDLPTGVVAKLEGFMLLERSFVLRLTNALAVKSPELADAVDDNDCALFFQKNMLERALGDMTMFDNYGRAEYYGDIFSILIRASGRASRQDNKGYGLLYRDTP